MIKKDNLTVAPIVETGKLGILHLKRFWSKMILHIGGELSLDDYSDEWGLDRALLSVLNIGIYQCNAYLFENQPSFEQFEDWVLAVSNGSLDKAKIQLFNTRVSGDAIKQEPSEETHKLSQEDWDFWNENGYLIVKNALPKDDCEEAIAVICEFLRIGRNNKDSWYGEHHAIQGIMVQLLQHPALQKNRESEKIRRVYEQLWGRTDLLLNMDVVGFNPPETNGHKFRGAGLHWDVSLSRPIPFGLQGILYLTDTAENQGAFTCVPGFHLKIDDWLARLPSGVNPREKDLAALGAIPIAGNAGDCIIWHHTLPHGASPNTHTLPRFVQYLNYQPIDYAYSKEWI